MQTSFKPVLGYVTVTTFRDESKEFLAERYCLFLCRRGATDELHLAAVHTQARTSADVFCSEQRFGPEAQHMQLRHQCRGK